MVNLILVQANKILGVLYSNRDPVIYKDNETTIDLLSNEFPDLKANKTRITFWGPNSRKIKGTVTDMIIDRLEIKPRDLRIG